MRFERGRVVNVDAPSGATTCCGSWSTPTMERRGSARWRSCRTVRRCRSPGRLFYNTLFDENAASHVALGSAYKFTLEGGEAMDDDTFARAGGNRSAVHVDFMIGSGELDIDGVLPTGSSEPLMRQGEWTT